MRCLHIRKYGRFPQLIETAIPKLGSNQYLIKMKYAPINPSDINFFQGFYGVKKTGFPIVGFQGAGIIQQTSNQQQNHLIGKKVSVLANMSNGTFATHIVSNQKQLIVWPIQQKIQNLSMQWINPVSCIGMVRNIQKGNFKVVVLSAATSQLCKMMIKYIKIKYPQVKIIGFSRSETYDQQLLSLGLNSINRLNDIQKIQELKSMQEKALYLDCVGGQFASKLFNNLPPDSLMVCYGRLSKEPLGNIDLGELYFKNKKIEGFWMNTFLKQIRSDQLNKIKSDIIKYQQAIFKSSVRKIYQLKDFDQAFRDSVKNSSAGKILLSLD